MVNPVPADGSSSLNAKTIVSLKAGIEGNSGPVKINFSDDSSLILKYCYLNDYLQMPFIKKLTNSSNLLSSIITGHKISSTEGMALQFSADCYRIEYRAKRLINHAPDDHRVGRCSADSANVPDAFLLERYAS